jgi:hypothetical protein
MGFGVSVERSVLHGRLAVAYRRIRVESRGVPGIWNHPMKEIINVPRLSPVINGPTYDTSDEKPYQYQKSNS